MEPVNACANFEGRAALLVNELTGIKGQMQTACSQNQSGQECLDLTQQHEGALLRYRMLLNETPGACRSNLRDPLSL